MLFKIIKAFGAFYILVSLLVPFILFFFAKEELKVSPLDLFSKYFLYFVMLDLVLRYFFQSLSSQNIKPFLTLNISKTKIIKYTFLKLCLHLFNLGSLIFLIIFSVLLISHDFKFWSVVFFGIGVYSVLLFNNFLNILLNKNIVVLIVIASILVLAIGLEKYEYIQLSHYSLPIFSSFFNIQGLFILPFSAMLIIAFFAFKNIKSEFYLDKGLNIEKMVAKTENIDFFNQFGLIGVFMNNDIRLIKRNKVPRKVFLLGC